MAQSESAKPKQSPEMNGNGALPKAGGDYTEKFYKVLVIGESGTGKTSIIKRYVHDCFSEHYRSTLGVDFALKMLTWDARTVLRLQLWDIGGQERFRHMTRVYYREAVGALVVFDVSSGDTFPPIAEWKADLDAKVMLLDQQPVPAILIANKCDKEERESFAKNPSQLDAYCQENGFTAWVECSAKANKGIDEAIQKLVTEIMRRESAIQATWPREPRLPPNSAFVGGDGDSVVVRAQRSQPSKPQSGGGGCCG